MRVRRVRPASTEGVRVRRAAAPVYTVPARKPADMTSGERSQLFLVYLHEKHRDDPYPPLDSVCHTTEYCVSLCLMGLLDEVVQRMRRGTRHTYKLSRLGVSLSRSLFRPLGH